MKKILLGIAALALVGLAAFFALTSPLAWRATHPSRDAAAAGPADLVNGKALFTAGDCAICHSSPGQADASKLGGGQALSSAFGTFYMPNISAHPKDGIGQWTTVQFVHAMREGVSPHGDNEYPAFPYTSYQRMTADDLRDLLAYLKTLPSVPGAARDHDLKFPFTMRRGVGLWRLAFLDGKALAVEPQKSPSWTRGRYLVEGPAHCAECHSPRNFMGSIVSGKRFSGGLDPEGKSYIPNITSDETGIAYWSKGEIASYLKDGVTPIGIKAGGDMAAIIANTAALPPADRLAIAAYVKSLPGVDSPNQGMPEPNRSALIQMLPQGADKSRQSKLDALSVMPAGQLDKAITLYVVDTKSLFPDQAQAGANSADDGKVLAATKLTVLSRTKDLLQVRIDGWQQEGSESALYALQGQRIIEALLSPAEIQKVVKGKTVHDAETNLNWNQGSLTAWVRADAVSPDLDRLWTYGGGLFGASCATCHALPRSGSYLANQWIGNLGAMKRYASLDDGQYRLLLAYLQYHSKDVNSPAVVAKP